MISIGNIAGRFRRLKEAVLNGAATADGRTHILIVVGITLIVVVVTRLGGALLFLNESRNTALRNAQDEVDRNVRLAETILNRQLLQVDSALATVPTLLNIAALSGDGAVRRDRAAQLLLGLNFQAFAHRDIFLVSPGGEVWASARPRPVKRPVPDEVVRKRGANTATRVIGPVRNAASGEWSIFLARSVEIEGAGAMEAVAEVSVSSLTTPLHDIAEKYDARLFIEREGGRVVASIPHNELLIGGMRLGTHPVADPDSVIESRRSLLYADLSVVKQVDKVAALADWARDRDKLVLWAGITGLLAILIAAAMLSTLLRRARKTAAEKQALSMLEEAVEAMSDGFVLWDKDDRLVACNSSYRKIYEKSAFVIKQGATFEEVVRAGALAGQYPQAGKDIDAFVQGVVDWHRNARGSYERLLPDGRWVLVTERRTASGGMVGIRADVTKLKQTMDELADANARVSDAMSTLQTQNEVLRDRDLTLRAQYLLFDTALNNMSHGLLMVDPDHRVIVCNRRFRSIFNLAADARLHGLSLHDVFGRPREDIDDKVRAEIREQQQRLAQDKVDGTFVVQMQNGHAIAITQRPTQDGGFVAIYEDVTEQKRAENRIRFLAHHDSLTNLPNRVNFRTSVEAMIRSLVADGQHAALLYLDLDRFKDVNDTLGHQTGDALLEAVGQRLRNCLRDSDVVARLGGDEFAIAFVSPDAEIAAAMLAKRIIEQLSRPYGLGRNVVSVGVSVGIATVAQPDVDVDTALKCADMALYSAKDNGRGQFRIFVPEMEEQLRSRLMIEQDLKQALANNEFRIAYQPLVDLATERIVGYEALLRWDCVTRGSIPPSVFIPLAEEMNLIGGIGAWCLEEACRSMAAWQEDIKLSVNLSPVQLRSDDIVEVVRGALTTSGLDPNRLELEITESALLEDGEQTMARLHRIKALGARIVLDDFGTGFSSLNYLRSFPFDKIKIDKVFVTEATSRADCEAIVQSVVELARRLGMTTTAEGIETQSQLDLVRRLGCDIGQGYLFAKPQSIFAALASLEAQRHGADRQSRAQAIAV